MGKPRFPIPLRGGGVGNPGFPTPLLQQPMFTLAIHAAAPHNAAMNIRLFLGGLRPPPPSHRMGGWGNRVSPSPCGAGEWGNRVSPFPSPRAYVHVRRGAPREPPGGRSRGRRRRGGVSPPPRRPASRQGVRPQTLPRAGGWGNLVLPWSRETVMRMAHHARCKRPGSAGVTPAPRLRGQGDGPLPDPPPLGAGTRLLPPAGGGWEGG